MPYLDTTGLSHFWQKIKEHVTSVVSNYLPLSGGTVTGTLTAAGASVRVKSTTIDRDGADPSETLYSPSIGILDKDGETIGYMQVSRSTAGTDTLNIYVANEVNGEAVYNRISLIVRKNGTLEYSLADPDAFIDALSLAASDIPSLPASKITSGTLALARGGTASDNTSRSINTVFAGPSSGSAGNAGWRKLVADDIPSLAASKIGSGTLPVARGGTGGTDAESARDGINAAGVGDQSAQKVLIGPTNNSDSLFSISANITNTANTSHSGDRVGLWAENGGLRCWNSTDSANIWRIIGLSGVLDFGKSSTTSKASIITFNDTYDASSCSYVEYAGIAQLRLAVKSTEAKSANTTYTVGTIVSGKRPADIVAMTERVGTNVHGKVEISTAGVVSVRLTQSASAGATIIFHAATYILA